MLLKNCVRRLVQRVGRTRATIALFLLQQHMYQHSLFVARTLSLFLKTGGSLFLCIHSPGCVLCLKTPLCTFSTACYMCEEASSVFRTLFETLWCSALQEPSRVADDKFRDMGQDPECSSAFNDEPGSC